MTIAVKNCGIDCGDSGDQLFEPHGRSRLVCACGAVDLDFLFAVVYCFQATHWGNVRMKQIQGDMALAWIRENNLVLMLLKNVL